MDSVTKVCRRCDIEQSATEYSKRSVSPDGLHLYCRECVRFLNKEARLVKQGLLVRVPRPEPTEKTCTRCKQSLPVEVFYKRKLGAHGQRDSLCPSCWTAYRRERFAANPDAHDVRKASIRAWRQANPERAAAADKRYRQAHPEQVAQWHRDWQERYPERARAHRSRRSARKRSATVVGFDAGALEARMGYFGNACWMCGGPFEQVDHVKPLSKGGLHILSNLRPACSDCNNGKHARWFGPQNLNQFIKN